MEPLANAGTLERGSNHTASASTLFFQRNFLCYTLILVHFFIFEVFIFHRGFLILQKQVSGASGKSLTRTIPAGTPNYENG